MEALNLSPIMKPKRDYWLIAIILIIFYGLHLRHATQTLTILAEPIHSDAAKYYSYARNLSVDHIFSYKDSVENTPLQPDAFCPPGYPFFASLFYDGTAYFGNKVLLGQTLLQIFSFLLLTFMVYKRFTSSVSCIAALFIWTFPHFISMNTYFLTESLFISEIAIILALALKKNFNNLDWFLVGMVIGIAALTRATLEYFPFFLVALFIYKKIGATKNYIYFLISALIPIISWKLRNYLQIGAISDPALTTSAIYHGSFLNFMYNNDPQTLGYAYRFDPESSIAYSSTKNTLLLIWERVQKKPIEYLEWYAIGKQFFLWQWDIFEGDGGIFIYLIKQSPWTFLPDMVWTYNIQKFFHLLWVAPTVLLSIILFIRKDKSNSIFIPLCCALVIYAALLHAVAAPYTRYGIPFKLPLIFIFLFFLEAAFNYCSSIHVKKMLNRFIHGANTYVKFK